MTANGLLMVIPTNLYLYNHFQLYEEVRYSNYEDDDPRAELLKGSKSGDVEDQKIQRNGVLTSPPSYFGQSEALTYQMKRLEDKIDQLDSLHKKHLDRPTLDDLNKEEAQIQSLTRDISEV